MPPEELTKIVLAIGGVLAGMGVMVALLLWMAFAISRAAAKSEREALASWGVLAHELSLAAPARRPGGLGMGGVYGGRELSIAGQYGRGKNSSDSTYVTLKVNFPVDLYLRCNQTRMLGVDYLLSGDAELDQRYHFLSRPPNLLSSFVAGPALRRALLQADVKLLTATPTEIYCLVMGIENDRTRLRAMVELVSELAALIDREVEAGRLPSQPPQDPTAYSELEQTAPTIRISRRALGLALALGALLVVVCLCLLTGYFLWQGISF